MSQVTKDKATIREAESVRERARATHAHLPQYEGKWDDWVPVRITQEVRTKMGLAFKVGDITIAQPERGEFGRTYVRSRTVYSFRNDINTEVRGVAVEEL